MFFLSWVRRLCEVMLDVVSELLLLAGRGV